MYILYSKNRCVASKQETYDNAVEDRMNLYTDLQKRVTQIKSALAGQFGRRSNEYTDALKY